MLGERVVGAVYDGEGESLSALGWVTMIRSIGRGLKWATMTI